MLDSSWSYYPTLTELTARADELPLERLSRIGCMSISKLKDAFHVRYGCTITQYIQGQRTEQAGRLLRETDLPVSQVAAIVG